MILLRHGQSEFNVVFAETRVDPGIHDPRLTGLGRRQARAAAADLRAHGVRRLIVSPYTRTLETAEIVADALGLSAAAIAVEPLVRERRAFSCDIGSPRSALGERWPALDFGHLDEQWWPEEEEPMAAVARRGAEFHARMRAREDWREIAVVTHWGFVLALTGQRLGNGETLRLDAGASPGAGDVTIAGADDATTAGADAGAAPDIAAGVAEVAPLSDP